MTSDKSYSVIYSPHSKFHFAIFQESYSTLSTHFIVLLLVLQSDDKQMLKLVRLFIKKLYKVSCHLLKKKKLLIILSIYKLYLILKFIKIFQKQKPQTSNGQQYTVQFCKM